MRIFAIFSWIRLLFDYFFLCKLRVTNFCIKNPKAWKTWIGLLCCTKDVQLDCMTLYFVVLYYKLGSCHSVRLRNGSPQFFQLRRCSGGGKNIFLDMLSNTLRYAFPLKAEIEEFIMWNLSSWKFSNNTSQETIHRSVLLIRCLHLSRRRCELQSLSIVFNKND